MDHRQDVATLTDEALERDLARALAVDPSPEFAARVRARIAEEPAPAPWRMAWVLSLAGAAAACIVVAVSMHRPEQTRAVTGSLAARAIGAQISAPYVGSGFSRTDTRHGEAGSTRPVVGPAEAGPHVQSPPEGGPHVLLDARETAALRSLIAGVRNSTVNLTPLLEPGAPAPMELPPVVDLVIAPIAIEPLAPQDGAHDPISRSGQGERQ